MSTIRIISPHIDDAFLSLGGSILKWKAEGLAVKVYNVFTISDWTTPDSLSGINYCLDVQGVTALRKGEEKDVGESVGFGYECWDFLDFPLRQHFGAQENEHLESTITCKLQQQLNHEDSFFFPIGMDHPDHILINKISLKFVGKGYNILYFEDLPYFSWGQFDYIEKWRIESRIKMPVFQTINQGDKEYMLRKYGSQVTQSWFQYMRAYSYNTLDNQHYERYWQATHHREKGLPKACPEASPA